MEGISMIDAPAQHMRALEIANQVRLARSRLKRQVASGEVDAADVIAAGEAEGFGRKQIIDARNRCTDPAIDTRKDGFGKQARHVWWIAH